MQTSIYMLEHPEKYIMAACIEHMYLGNIKLKKVLK